MRQIGGYMAERVRDKNTKKQRAKRNRTLILNEEERKGCLEKCLRFKGKDFDSPPVDYTIIGDTFSVLNHLPDRFVDLLIVDPPYNLGKNFSTSKFRKMNDAEYEEYTRRWIKASIHTLKKTASIYVCCDWKTGLVIGKVLQEYFIVQNRITWQREKGRGALSNWKNSMEDIWFATRSDTYTFNVESVKQRRKVIAPYRKNGSPKDWVETDMGRFRDTYPSNFWDDITVPYWSMAENTDHPTQKPEKLIAKMILASSNPGDLVLDPFLGSGTSSVTAKKLGRRYIGIEQEEEFAAIAEKRLKLANFDTSIQGYTGGVFWERNTQEYQKRVKRSNDD